MVSIAEEKFSDELYVEILDLLNSHHNELDYSSDFEKVDIDVESYKILSSSNVLKVFIARDANLKAIGYISYVVTKSIVNKNIYIAAQSGLFVEKSSRGGMVGLKLIDYADNVLSNEYCLAMITQTFNVNNNISSLLKRKGYEPFEYTYKRSL